jgi:hypothetical protein
LADTRTQRAAIALVVLAGGCSPVVEAETGSGRPAVGLTAPAVLAHPSDDSHPTADVDRNDPTAVAERHVIDTLAEQGLVATITASELLQQSPDAAKVQIAVIHTGRGHPHQSLYAIDLGRTGDGWRSVGFGETAG